MTALNFFRGDSRAEDPEDRIGETFQFSLAGTPRFPGAIFDVKAKRNIAK
jgi:hypothetical protein